jgi:hypothetical protein
VGIIILSNSAQVFNLRNDNRQEMLVVPELSVDTGNAYFDKREVLVDAPESLELRQRIFNEDTTVMGSLVDFAGKYLTTPGGDEAKRAAVREKIDARAVAARSSLKSLLQSKGKFEPELTNTYYYRDLVLKLLEYEYGHGILAEKVDLPLPQVVVSMLKQYAAPPLGYDPTTTEYSFREPRFYWAAKRLQDDMPDLFELGPAAALNTP